MEKISYLSNILNKNLYAISLYARQIAGTLVLLLIARYLSVFDFGLFTSYKNIVGFFFVFANLGFSDYIIVSSKANVKEVKLKIALFMLNALNIVFFVIFCSLFFKLDSHLLFMLVAVRTFFDGTFFALILPYFQASKKFHIVSIINIIYAFFITAIGVLSYIFKLSLAKFLILNIILGGINFIQCSYYAKINYCLLLRHLKDYIKLLDKTIINYGIVELAILFYIQIQSFYVSCYAQKEDAALYFAAFTIGSIICLLVNAQRQKLIPEFIKTDVNQVKGILAKNLISIGTIITLVLIFFIIFGKNVLVLLYGKEYYAQAYLLLLLFTASSYFTGIITITGTYLTASGKVYMKTPLQMEAIVFAIVSLVLLRNLGIILGATVSYLLTSFYLAIRYMSTINNEINKDIHLKGDYK